MKARNAIEAPLAQAPEFGPAEERAARTLIDLALAEDLQARADLTSDALIDPQAHAAISVVARQAGVLAGGPAAALVFQILDAQVRWRTVVSDGERLHAGTEVAVVSGPIKSLLAGERTALNLLTHLSGVATLTRRLVDAVAGTRASILDTRKTFPGYRLLQKYAVRAGGGTNHRLGLYDGVLIKDNHLAAWRSAGDNAHTVADAVAQARQRAPAGVPIEVEVDTLEQLADALRARPELVLLDNMPLDLLRQAVSLRDASAPATRLEASGSVTLANVAAIAGTGVDRISIGALTHSAPALDLAFDWKSALG
jgi:nicotinate-nucleotide pyrophosphorylase (carboxylating)